MDESLNSSDPLKKTLCEIDRFGTKKNRENLLFLARAVATLQEVEHLSAGPSVVPELFSALCLKTTPPKAVPILQRMLQHASYDQKRVSRLESHTDHSSFSMSVTVSNLYMRLSFFELLLLISLKIDASMPGRLVLKHMLMSLTDEKIGAPREDIKSALQLFTCMLTAGTLTWSEPHTVISELREHWSSINNKDEMVKTVVEDIEDVVARNVTQVGASGIWRVNDIVEDNVETKRYQRRCSKYVLLVIVLIPALLAIALAVATTAICVPLLTATQLNPLQFHTLTDVTLLASEKALNTYRYPTFEINVSQLYTLYPGDYKTCTVNTSIVACHPSTPDPFPKKPLYSAGNYSVSGCNNNRTCFIKFVNGSIIEDSGAYVLKDSYFNITLETDVLGNETVLLYLFRDIFSCVSLSEVDAAGLVGGEAIKFSVMGNASFEWYTKNNSFFCGFWHTNSSEMTLNYSVSAVIYTYDFDSVFANKSNKNIIRTLNEPSVITYNLSSYYHHQYVCMLVHLKLESASYAYLNLTITPVKITSMECLERNIKFLVLITLSLVSVGAILCVCWCCSRNKTRYIDYSGYSVIS